jgi:outer membrane protein
MRVFNGCGLRGSWKLVLSIALAALAPLAPLRAQAPGRGAVPVPTTEPLTLSDVVALAVRNNPDARVAEAQARASLALAEASRGPTLPTIAATSPVQVIHGSSGGGIGGDRTTVTPGISINYLLLDFGGRGGAIAQARQTAAAAAATSNATLQNTVLLAEAAYFAYNGARALYEASGDNVKTAMQGRDAAIQRWRVGLATVADTLQAATALAQAQLALLTAQGQVQTARGNLATVMGTSAEQPFEVAATPGPLAVGLVGASVDSLMATAIRARPELAQAQAQASSALAQVRVARSAAYPSITVGANAGNAFSTFAPQNGRTYQLNMGVALPIFNGFQRQNASRAARELVAAANERVESTRLQIANQVFTAYNNLQVGAARVRVAAQLLSSAVQSEAVARGRYQEGVGSIIDLLTAQSALAQARAQEAQSRWQWQSNLAQLAHDVGSMDRAGAAGLPIIPIPSTTPIVPTTPVTR